VAKRGQEARCRGVNEKPHVACWHVLWHATLQNMENTERNAQPLVSVLFVTYRRLPLLERTLASFLANTAYSPLELVVADDGSPADTQRAIRSLPFDRYVLAATNCGLGANLNSGLDACRGEFVLVLQDDWECVGPPQYLQHAVELMQADPTIGLVKFYGVEHKTVVGQHRGERVAPYVCVPSTLADGLPQRHIYSDTPHLRSRALTEVVGRYREGCRMEECEQDYETRFATQRVVQAALFPQYYNRVFVHTGEELSHRTATTRARTESALLPIARWLRQHCLPLYLPARAGLRALFTLLERLRAVR